MLAIAFAAAALAACGSSEEDVRNGSIAAARGDALYLLREDAPRARKVPGVRGPAVWTPDGEWLAFNTYRPIVGPRVSWTRHDLWLVRPDGTERRLLARNVPLGAFSPDGKTMVFSNDSCAPRFTEGCVLSVDNSYELYSFAVESGRIRRLTHNTGYEGHPTWSPDGARFAYATDRGVEIMEHDGQRSQLLVHGAYFADPVWSPRGDEILVRTARGWATVPVRGGKLRRLKRGPPGPEFGAEWSPDGRRIAYLFRRADAWTAHDPLQIWVMNPDGAGRRPLTKTFGWSVPSWGRAS